MENKLSKIGLGAYRITIKSKEHQESARLALELGCNLFDTSSNYTYGDSERLIGKIIAEKKGVKPVVMTKAGYIQGPNLKVYQELRDNGKAKEDLVDLGDDLKHSIHPEFLENQITNSLERLGVQEIDYFLIHNPEYYFKTKDSNEETYFQRLKKAFMHLEEEVFKGRIKMYGVSSNTFSASPEDKDFTNLQKILNTVKDVSSSNHFRAIQFPLNLVERGALKVNYDGKNLIELAKKNKILTFANRPLNAFSRSGFLRLANYPTALPDQPTCLKKFESVMQILLNSVKEQGKEKVMDVLELPIIKQVKEIWLNMPTPDSVDQVFLGHFFPLVGNIFGRALKPEESQPFYELYDIAETRSREIMTANAQKMRSELENEGIIGQSPETSLSLMAINKYLEWGVDHVLVGMKRPQYVREFQSLF